MFPVSGPDRSAGTVTVLATSRFPAASRARNATMYLPGPDAATGPVYAVHAPVPTAYSTRATPDVASSAVTVTDLKAVSTVAALVGAVASMRTARFAGADMLPARSVA